MVDDDATGKDREARCVWVVEGSKIRSLAERMYNTLKAPQKYRCHYNILPSAPFNRPRLAGR